MATPELRILERVVLAEQEVATLRQLPKAKIDVAQLERIMNLVAALKEETAMLIEDREKKLAALKEQAGA